LAVAHAGHDDRLLAGALRGRPVLIVTADDQNRADMEGLAAALRKNGSAALQHAAVQSDHSFSDRRIGLRKHPDDKSQPADRKLRVIRWLAASEIP